MSYYPKLALALQVNGELKAKEIKVIACFEKLKNMIEKFSYFTVELIACGDNGKADGISKF